MWVLIKYILCVSKNLFVKNIIFNKRNLFSLSLWVKFKCIYVPIHIHIALVITKAQKNVYHIDFALLYANKFTRSKTMARSSANGLRKARARDVFKLSPSVAADDGDGLVEDAGDGLVEDAGLVDDRVTHAQYGEDELPLVASLLPAFTPPEGQLVATLP